MLRNGTAHLSRETNTPFGQNLRYGREGALCTRQQSSNASLKGNTRAEEGKPQIIQFLASTISISATFVIAKGPNEKSYNLTGSLTAMTSPTDPSKSSR
jgi:hypothetical protein